MAYLDLLVINYLNYWLENKNAKRNIKLNAECFGIKLSFLYQIGKKLVDKSQRMRFFIDRLKRWL